MIEKRVRARWAVDAVLLAEVGRQLESQKFEMSVTLPRKLVLQAIAKWSRDDAMFKLRRETKRKSAFVTGRAQSVSLVCTSANRGLVRGS